jgi:DNA-directed RNA polymerase subunit RPC12/RpoP
MGKLTDWIDKMLERDRERRRSRCPHCNDIYDPYENEDARLVTLWGSEYNETHEIECYNCEGKFYTHEVVDRTYKTVKTAEELQDEPYM